MATAVLGLWAAAQPGGVPTPARAQGAADTADPGQIQRRLEDARPVPEQPAPAGPALEAPPAVDAEAEAAFVLAAVVLEGNSVFSDAELAPLYADFLAQRIGFPEIAEIARRITEAYREAGYPLSRALVPPQEATGGTLRVRIVEGYVGQVVFEGADGQEALLAGYAAAIAADRPLRLRTLERQLLLINDLAGFTVADSRLAETETPGAYRLTIAVARDALDGTVYLDNRGTPEVGRLQGYLAAGANSLLGGGERFQLGFFTVPDEPRELLFADVTVQQPLGVDGTLLTTRASRSYIDAGGELSGLDTEGESTSLVVRVEHPAIRSRAETLWLFAAFDVLNSEEDRLGDTSFDDRLRVLRAGTSYLRSDGWAGVNQARLEISQGLPVLGASESGDSNLSRADGEGVFTKAALELSRTQQLGDLFSLRAALKGQIAADQLLSAEEFALGGSQFGRAYDFAELTGEHGLAGSIEARFGQRVDEVLFTSYQLYAFYDLGAVWNENASDDLGRQSLASAGGGLRLGLPGGVEASLELAKPLTRDVDTRDDRSLRVFFSIAARF